MAIAVMMPRQGQSVETCFITGWHKSKGDKVKKGDILFSYETDKAAFDEEAPESGVLLEKLFEEGDEVPVLETVAIIGQPGEDYGSMVSGKHSKNREDLSNVKETGKPADKSAVKSPGIKTAGPSKDPESTRIAPGDEVPDTGNHDGSSTGERLRVSPLARKLAQEHSLALTKIMGTGPHGRIIERDIKNAAANMQEGMDYGSGHDKRVLKSSDPPDYKTGVSTGPDHIPESKGDYTDTRLSNMRRIIAGKMEHSLQNSAQLTHHMSADARKMLAWRKEIKAEKGKHGIEDISINDMVCYTVIKALKVHSFMNAHFMDDSIRKFNKVHLGIAVDTERGLMVPVLRNADDMNAGGLAGRIRSLAEECRKGSVDPELLASERASFTVTNLGSYGVEMFTPVLNLPQVGILGINTITYRPADTGDGVIGFIPFIGLSLTYDHRAVDGAPASVFLAEVKKEIENIQSSR